MISRDILYTGMWERKVVTTVLRAVSLYPEAVFLDLGANLGVYSVMVAALRDKAGDRREGRVVAVDGMADNLAHIRLSLQTSKISESVVTFLHNSVRWLGGGAGCEHD